MSKKFVDLNSLSVDDLKKIYRKLNREDRNQFRLISKNAGRAAVLVDLEEKKKWYIEFSEFRRDYINEHKITPEDFIKFASTIFKTNGDLYTLTHTYRSKSISVEQHDLNRLLHKYPTPIKNKTDYEKVVAEVDKRLRSCCSSEILFDL